MLGSNTRAGDVAMPRTILALAALCALLCLAGAPEAQAGTAPYAAVGTFGSGKVGLAFGVAVDQGSGDVYVASFSEGTGVDKFDSEGNLLSPPSPLDTEARTAQLSGAAVDPLNGDIEVVDGKNEAIQTFEPSGSLASEFSVSGSASCIFFCVLGKATLTQIATDSAGNVYLPNPPNHEVQEFNPGGSETIQTFTGSTVGAFGEPHAVAVDSEGNVYVADSSNGRVVRIEHSTGAQSVLDNEGAKTVAIDPSNNDVFVGEYNGNDACGSESSPCFHVVEYGPGGERLGDFGAGSIGHGGLPGPTGEAEPASNTIAVNATTHNVYVTDGSRGEVWIFSQVPPPTASIQAASEVTASSATLNGGIDPRENETAYHFEYVDEAHYNPSATDPYGIPADSPTSVGGTVPEPDAAVGAGNKEVAVFQPISSLEANTTYHFRLVATTNKGQVVDSADETFSTAQAPPVLLANSVLASNVTQSDVIFNASINPQHLDTHYWFDYGQHQFEEGSGCAPTVPYASAPAAPVDMGEGTGPEAVEVHLASANVLLHPGMGSRELQPNTVYRFQVVAENAAGASCEPEATFITLPPDPLAATAAASEITPTAARLNGAVTPGSTGPNSDTTWQFQYGTDPSYSAGSVPGAVGDAGMGPSAVAVSAPVTSLAPNTTYHYRLLASNANDDPAAAPAAAPQLAHGADHSFTTPPSEPVLGQPSGPTETDVTLNGRVSPDGHDLHYRFEYGTTSGYGQSSASEDAGEGAGLTQASANLAGLTPGVTYHYRLVAIGGGGEAYSPDSTFTLYAPAPAQGTNPFASGQETAAPFPTLPLLGAPVFTPPTELRTHPRPLTNAQKLTSALKACAKKRGKQRRQCSARARSRFGGSSKKTKAKRTQLAKA